MNILVDGQTLSTPEINRGIGIYYRNVLCNMMRQNMSHSWYITVHNSYYCSCSLQNNE